MPLEQDLLSKVKAIKTESDLKALFEELDKDLTEKNASDRMSALVLAAGNVLVSKYPKLFSKERSSNIMWQFIRHWLPEFAFSPLRMVIYEDLLYPQFEKNFKTITPDIFKWVQESAKSSLEKHKSASPTLKAHWQSIIDGQIPYGLMLEEDYLKQNPPPAIPAQTISKIGAEDKTSAKSKKSDR